MKKEIKQEKKAMPIKELQEKREVVRMNKIKHLGAGMVILGIFFLSGCAFGTRRPILTYSPILPTQPGNNIAIRIVSFKDERKIKDTVGYVRDTIGMRCAKVVPQNDVVEWITSSLKSELKNAGYTISDEEKTSNVVQGMVFDILCDTYINFNGRMTLKIILKRDEKTVLEKDYSAKKSERVDLLISPEGFAKTLKLTLQETLKQVVADVNKELLKQ